MVYQHHSIVVVGRSLKVSHNKAVKMFGVLVSPIITSINGIQSYFIAPDGSGEGWEQSDDMDKLREKFIQYLDDKDIRYAHISIDDDGRVEII